METDVGDAVGDEAHRTDVDLGFGRWPVDHLRALGIGGPEDVAPALLLSRSRHDRHLAEVGFGGRSLGDGEPKYLNSAEGPVFHKGRLLYNYHRAAPVARGRKRGIAPVIATQRLAKLSSSVISELQNFLVGLNVFDRDIARAADLLGFSAKDADQLRKLAPGEFFAMGPAMSPLPVLARMEETITQHLGATPKLTAAAAIDGVEAEKLLDLSALREVSNGSRDTAG